MKTAYRVKDRVDCTKEDLKALRLFQSRVAGLTKSVNRLSFVMSEVDYVLKNTSSVSFAPIQRSKDGTF